VRPSGAGRSMTASLDADTGLIQMSNMSMDSNDQSSPRWGTPPPWGRTLARPTLDISDKSVQVQGPRSALTSYLLCGTPRCKSNPMTAEVSTKPMSMVLDTQGSGRPPASLGPLRT